VGLRADMNVLESLASAGIQTQVTVPTVDVSDTARKVSRQQWRLAPNRAGRLLELLVTPQLLFVRSTKCVLSTEVSCEGDLCLSRHSFCLLVIKLLLFTINRYMFWPSY
jgi:hypothetical protein